MSQFYDSAVVLVLAIHLAWILWVIFGAFWTRGHRWLTGFHIASLVWGIVVETGPWPCPLTIAEQHFQRLAGIAPYRGSFLLHYLDSIVYPNVSVLLLTICGVAVCAANLAIYSRRWWLAVLKRVRA
ncbi:MAG: DUF2784 domain-containing protein [Acidobacteriaceae bacterium]